MKKKKVIIIAVIIFILGGAAFGVKPLMRKIGINQMISHYKNRVKEFEILNKQHEGETEVLFVGDSITEMYPVNEFYDVDVVNRGISGDTVEGLLMRMDESIFELQPKKIVFMMGTNDIFMKASEEEIVSRIENVIREIRKELPDTQIFVQSLYPINKGDHKKINRMMIGNRTNEVIEEINEGIVNLAEDMDFTFIDMNSSLKDEDGNFKLDYTTEGIHPSLEGYEVITSVLKPFIEQ